MIPGMYFDWTIVLIIIGGVIASIASANVTRTFNKYSKYTTEKRMTGTQVAEYILQYSGITNVRVERIAGNLTDHYDPTNKVLRLSDATADSTSIAAIGVAAHECGHAVQDAQGYFFMTLRQKIVPIVNIGSNFSWPILIMGAIAGFNETLINIGIILFASTLIFQLVTLPVEFDASNRALKIMEEGNILTASELPYARKTLRAAAMTYVAAAIAGALSLLRVLILFGGRSRD
ncbi:zinc metallopeptidase [Aerococcus agrisoli]|jgi:Zn-dependent membrane protease YugP|uniref:Zinc metallopeptidase n=1 Tax=Aerococcus agrisoli TaxID=2487350 RepID=A0A3N4GD60_9LACT|nr:zinc metallopeptidase [Aerococcus agrisoli]RPA60773.1 zinc metallopeptidase [Aerococcus agrisoli]